MIIAGNTKPNFLSFRKGSAWIYLDIVSVLFSIAFTEGKTHRILQRYQNRSDNEFAAVFSYPSTP